MNRTDAPYRLLGFEVSYFTAKVRPALRYKGLWVDERRADYGEIQRRTGAAFIPVVITPEDETWQDSTDIYDRLERRHPDPPLFPTTPLQRMACHLAELYADEFALIPAMQTRWGSELGESSARDRFIAMIGDEERGTQGAARMIQARYAVGAAEEAREAIDAHLREVLDALSAHFQASPYLLGERMAFGDCALMGPIDGHFFTDLVSRRLLLETARPVVGWIEHTRYPNEDEQGAWLPDDEIAPTLVEALRVMGRDTAPVLLDTVRAVEAWADGRKADQVEPPRAVGPCETTIRGVKITRGAFTYALFSLQRVLDVWHGLDDEGRARVGKVVAGSGWDEVLAYTPRHRLKRDGFRIIFED